VYIDDILIFSTNLEDHITHVRAVLDRLLANHLFVKSEKCQFHQRAVSFLGHQISLQGVRLEDKKVDVVRSWPVPTTIKRLQRFLGFAYFNRRFMRNLVSATLTSLLKGGPRRLVWFPAADEAFRLLKGHFTSAPC
jgi:hypothetical protein